MIILGLLSINWLSEQLWQQFITSEIGSSAIGGAENSDDLQLHYLTQITKMLPLLTSTQADPNFEIKKSALAQLSTALKIPIETKLMSDYSWLAEQKEKLINGDVVLNYDEKDYAIFYVKDANSLNIYQLGPFNRNLQLENRLRYLKWLFLCLSYLLLAGVIALWTRPLWRDLKQLTSMANDIANGKLDVAINTNKHSPIKQIVTTFKDMAHRIIRLLSDQKHLVNAVSHELRTPLSRLRFSLAMFEGVNEEQRKEMAKDIGEIEALIDEMLSYARLENVSQDIKKSSVELTSLIAQQIHKLNRSTGVTIKWQKPAPCHFNGNEHLLERAIQNLSTNALKYAKSNVEISLKTTATHIQIMIDDDGPGIPLADRENIFEPFFRLELHRNRSENQPKGGYGLGLAIVKRICEWHKGRCIIGDSTLGGCQFIINLPRDIVGQ